VAAVTAKDADTGWADWREEGTREELERFAVESEDPEA
jgi:hypothetical protein